ncbi:MAG: tRNA threonylcarbamoyladenosine dehydratase [Verrucomicrobia bacterium ADurb.Bin345]|nr:MAG: tRNA threonylcarbamoyladenosine dehydratase [Verrucomicrobia bacterium ADurb.Bin345]
MMTEPIHRFRRTELLLGKAALNRLRDAHVTVVGLGAVGSYAVETLARAGIGHFRLVDFDRVQPSNINRQLLALESTLGRSKVELARERVLGINPLCEVEALEVFADAATRPAILAPPCDAIIDAIDSVGPKTGLLADAVRAGIPLIVSSMGAALRTDPSAIRTDDISNTAQCRLAQKIRKRLRRHGISKGIRCVFSTEPAQGESAAPEEAAEESGLQRGRKRKPLGSLSTMTGIFGMLAAHEVIISIATRGRA